MSEDADLSVFQGCMSSVTDATDSMMLLECVSNTTEANLQAAVDSLTTGLNTFFLIYGGALVFFMQLGFAMLCAGSIRSKNVKNVILWNLLDSAGAGISYWAVGFAFAYGGDDSSNPKHTFVGNTDFFLGSFGGADLQFWFFQWAFASAVSSIVAGTIAERLQMRAYLMYSTFLVGFVYPVVSHAIWSYQGFLSKFSIDPLFGSGVIDLAGSGAVHFCGGVAALAGGIVLGPRIGRFHDRDGNPLDEPAEIASHNTALMFLGTFALWFGWYGFNPASVLLISNETAAGVVALVTMNTTLSACAGAMSAMFTSSLMDWRSTGVFTWDCAYTMNGALTGLVAITSGCATVDTWAAVIIGVFAGWFYLLGSKLCVYLRFDDAVDAVAVHMFGGFWGMIATGLFSAPHLIANAYGANDHVGWFYEWSMGSGDFTLLGCQLIALLFIFGWTFTVMGAWWCFINFMGWLRIDPLEEEAGLDISRHKGAGYVIEESDKDVVDQMRSSRHQTVDSKTFAAAAAADDIGAEVDA